MPKTVHSQRWIYASALLVGVGALGAISYFYFQDFRRSREIDQEINRLEQEKDALQVRNVQLGDLLRYLNSETYAEQRARLELGLVKPGERVVVVPPQANPPPPAKSPPSPVEPSTSPLRGWWSYFFGRRP